MLCNSFIKSKTSFQYFHANLVKEKHGFLFFFKIKDHVSKILNFLGKLTLRKVKVTQISGSFERGDDDAMFVHLLPGRHPEVPLGGRHF